MTEKNYAYYNVSNGFIENVIVIDELIAPNLTWQEGYAIVQIPDVDINSQWSSCGIGWSYIENKFVEPPRPPELEQPVVDGAQTL